MLRLMRFRKIFFSISAAVILPGVISLIFFGLLPSIDFTGGTLWEIEISPAVPAPTVNEMKAVFAGEGLEAEVQPAGEGRFVIKTAPLETDRRAALSQKIAEGWGGFTEIRFETLGPRLGKELLMKAAAAVVLAMAAIFAYLAYRFRHPIFGAAALLAVFHDTLILLGVFSLLGYFGKVEVDTLFVTAVLTTLSFSVHDTVVVFDRIREIRGRMEIGFEPAVDQAVGETLVRSLNNSLTIIFMLAALLALGGESLRLFVLALLVGTVAGTYSSTFTAAPLLLVLQDWAARFRSRRQQVL